MSNESDLFVQSQRCPLNAQHLCTSITQRVSHLSSRLVLPSRISLLHLKLNGVLLPHRLPILEQQRRNRNKRHSDKAQNTVPPAQSQRLVHAWPCERQQRAKQAPQASYPCDGARSVLGETVDHVGL